MQCIDQYALDKVFGRFLGLDTVEGDDDHGIDTRAFKQM